MIKPKHRYKRCRMIYQMSKVSPNKIEVVFEGNCDRPCPLFDNCALLTIYGAIKARNDVFEQVQKHGETK